MSTCFFINDAVLENDPVPSHGWMCGVCDERPKFASITELFDHKVRIHISTSASVACKPEVYNASDEVLLSSYGCWATEPAQQSDDDSEDNLPLSALQNTMNSIDSVAKPEDTIEKPSKKRAKRNNNPAPKQKETFSDVKIEKTDTHITDDILIDVNYWDNAEDENSNIDQPTSPTCFADQETLVLEKDKSCTCRICHEVFPTKKCLSKHKVIHKCQETGDYKCTTCGKRFPKYDNFQRHIVIHQENRPRPFKCEICNAAFYNSADLKRHRLLHVDVKPYTCEQCHEGFIRQDALLSHYATHTGVPCLKYACKVCGKVLNSPSARAMHSKKHTKKSVFCPEPKCTFSCYLKSQLRQHIKVHSGEKKFLCSECGRTFGRKNDMKNHVLNVHQNFRPHACPDCPKRFTLASTLKGHRQTHLNIRQFMCDICGRRFNHPSTLRKHSFFLHGDMALPNRKQQAKTKNKEMEGFKEPSSAVIAIESALSDKLPPVMPTVSMEGLSAVPVTIHIPNISMGLEQSFANAFVISTVSLPQNVSSILKSDVSEISQ